MNIGIKTLNVMFAVSLPFFLCLNSNITLASSNDLLSQLSSIAIVYSKFNDEINLTSSTPRYLVNQRIVSLRNLKYEMTYINAKGCPSIVKDSALKAMDFGIEGFERFANKSSFSEDSSFSLFRAYNARVMQQFRECTKKIKNSLQLEQEQEHIMRKELENKAKQQLLEEQNKERQKLENKNSNEQKTDLCTAFKSVIRIAISNRDKGISTELSEKMLLSLVNVDVTGKDKDSLKESVFKSIAELNWVVYEYNKMNEEDIYNLLIKEIICNDKQYQ
jgi:hypothetical protein